VDDGQASVDAAPSAPRLWKRLRSAAVADIGPLRRHREFRLLFISGGVSLAGSMLTSVAVPFQVYAISHSSLLVGVMSLTLFVPYVTVGIFGGAVADAVDRRKLVLVTEVGLAVCSALLVANSVASHPQLWALLIVNIGMATLDALQRPSLAALLPRVVDKADLPAATAVNMVFLNIGQLVGPALAGVLIAVSGVKLVYGIDVVSFVLSLVALIQMRAVPPAPDAERPSLARIAEGFRYARSRQDLLGTYTVDMAAMFFGMPEALFPQLASRLGGPAVLGLLFTAPAIGSLLVSVTAGWAPRVRRQGRVIVFAAMVWGAGIVVLGIASSLWLAVIGLVIAGGADMVSGLMRSTIWNQSIPDSLRGRLAGIELVSYTSGPLLGNFEGGAAEALGGLGFSIVSGGVACIVATGLLAFALPGLWRYDAGAAGPAGEPG
jgi:MFS family permease